MAVVVRRPRISDIPFDIPMQSMKYVDCPFVDELLRSVDRVIVAISAEEHVASASLGRIVCMARSLSKYAHYGPGYSHVTFTQPFGGIMAACLLESKSDARLLELGVELAPLVSKWAYTSAKQSSDGADDYFPLGWWKYITKLQEPLNIADMRRRMPSKEVTKACWDALVAIVRDVPAARSALSRSGIMYMALESHVHEQIRKSDEERCTFLYYLLLRVVEPDCDVAMGRAVLDDARIRFQDVLRGADPTVYGTPAYRFAHLAELYST